MIPTYDKRLGIPRMISDWARLRRVRKAIKRGRFTVEQSPVRPWYHLSVRLQNQDTVNLASKGAV